MIIDVKRQNGILKGQGLATEARDWRPPIHRAWQDTQTDMDSYIWMQQSHSKTSIATRETRTARILGPSPVRLGGAWGVLVGGQQNVSTLKHHSSC